MREISMCGLFLLEAAKKADHEFQTSRSYTVRSAEDDISKMTTHLVQEKVLEERVNRGACTVMFKEPIEIGMKKIVFTVVLGFPNRQSCHVPAVQ